MAAEVLNIIKKMRLGEDYSAAAAAPPAASSSSTLAPTHEKDIAVGFDDDDDDGDLLAIKERLCGDQSSKLQVISIATNAYLDPLIIESFHIRAWVTVSQDYSAQKVISDLSTSMKKLNTEESSGQSNDLDVYQRLKGRRYLIVVDDIWSTRAWDDIKMIFPNDNNGSRILLTTRLSDVAAYADSSSPLHEMKLMGTDRSWNLLQHKVFKEENCPFELVSIGKMIAKGCRGLPLAIVVIGGLLSTVSKTRASWKEIAENIVKSAVNSTEDGRIENILSLSYAYLPHYLRPCFLYLGAYPEDHEIRASKFIKLWIAEGFIKSSVSSKSFEEMAEDYLEDLVKRSLVMVSQRKSSGRIKSCRVHDVMRELCIRKAQQDKFLVHVMGNTSVSDKSVEDHRRVCLTRSRDLNELAHIYGLTIRTIICFQESDWSNCHVRYFRFLRVLDLEYAFNFDPDVKLISPYYYLNLQTLIIHRKAARMFLFPDMLSWQSDIWRMPQLRHVYFNFSASPNPEDAPIIIKMIPNIKKLGIYYYSEDRNKIGQLENLVHLQQLETLKLTVIKGLCSSPAFPRTMKKLNFGRNVGLLPNLQVLKLRDASFGRRKWETREGEFPVLQYLLIERANLKEWIIESSSHFPSLKCLVLHCCRHLLEIPEGIGEIATLELIDIAGSNRSLTASAKRIRDEQQSWGNLNQVWSCSE
ncbi:hypothetical protein ABFX02_06G201811 [Erythranthe guttata]